METAPVQTVGTTEDGPVLGKPVDLAVGRHGHVLVADLDRSTVWVLSPTGDSLTTIGRSGRGPGEFSHPQSLAVGPEDSLFVYDSIRRRVSVFGPSAARPFIYSFPLPTTKGRTPSRVYPLPSGRLLAKYTRPKNPNLDESGTWILEVDRRGHVRGNEVAHLPLREIYQNVPSPGNFRAVIPPFGRKPVYEQDPEGRICYGWTDSLTIQCASVGRPDTTVLRVDHEPLRVTTEDLEREREGFDADALALLEEAGWHDTHPAFEQLTIDRLGRFWILPASRAQFPDDTVTWYVVDASASTYRTTTLSVGHRVEAATEHYVYTNLYPIRSEMGMYRIESPS